MEVENVTLQSAKSESGVIRALVHIPKDSGSETHIIIEFTEDVKAYLESYTYGKTNVAVVYCNKEEEGEARSLLNG